MFQATRHALSGRDGLPVLSSLLAASASSASPKEPSVTDLRFHCAVTIPTRATMFNWLKRLTGTPRQNSINDENVTSDALTPVRSCNLTPTSDVSGYEKSSRSRKVEKQLVSFN
ncbi:unnamed protein product [Caenorhabditis auriculariae]|uniref:Uncharacterized protein n=1 Tax=Caenorhabditis auriculariae TaxID=2777116 RepID=A0A8S1HFF9_9PELO|nr:unnamed protein product [Caenorhabditis auriculariae]